MPCISGNYQSRGGLFLDVIILHEDFLLSESEATEEQATAANVRRVQALTDTGASRTCLTKEGAQAANLSVVGKQEMISASETTAVNTYLFSLGIPLVREVDPTGQLRGPSSSLSIN